MNRKLLVTLLRKDIQELDMITEGFMEMNEYPKTIILLAQRKTEDIQSYIKQLADLKAELNHAEATSLKEFEAPGIDTTPIPAETFIIPEPAAETENKDEKVQDEIEVTFELIEQEETPIAESAENTVELIIEQPVVVVEKPLQEPKEEEEEEEEEEEIKPVDEEPRKTVLSERAVNTVQSRNEILSKVDNSLGATLANKKIDDIKQAINIGDRFRFQRELFKGNGEDMNKTLNYINQLATFIEVQSFLGSKYNWAENNESVEDFYQIVKRRFL